MNSSIVIPAITALVSALIVAWIAPFVQWYIELKRIKIQQRKTFIKEVRKYILKARKGESDGSLEDTVIYSQLRPYLSKGIIKRIEVPGADKDTVAANYRNGVEYDLLDELAILERKWDLL